MNNKYTIKTDGSVSGTEIYLDGTFIGSVSAITVVPPKPKLTVIKIGSEDYLPSQTDLEQWKKIFENAAHDPGFKIFAHSGVNIEQIDLGTDDKPTINIIPFKE